MKISGRIIYAAAGAFVSLSGTAVLSAYVMAMLATLPPVEGLAHLTGSSPPRPQEQLMADAAPSWWRKLVYKSGQVFASMDLTAPDGVLMVEPGDRRQLQSHFDALNYSLPKTSAEALNRMDVPRLYVRSLPHDLAAADSSRDLKRDFIKAMLPLMLAENEKILADRHRAEKLAQQVRSGGDLYAVNVKWLMKLAKRYDIANFDPYRGDWKELLRRVDAVPPSLAMAQAAVESGWGTSRFARQGNAVFGQWSWRPGSGIIPAGRKSSDDHEVRRFGQLSESVGAYLHNLNTHHYYGKFRSRRADLQLKGKPVSGIDLVQYVDRYSTDGPKYIIDVRDIIESNSLHYLDDAQLRPATGSTLSSS